MSQNGNGRNGNGNGDHLAQRLAGAKPDKIVSDAVFPVRSLDDMLMAIRRSGGTGKLEINFKNGYARGEAKWKGMSREE